MTAPAQTTDLTGTWAIDPVHSSISFSVRHLVVSKVRGTFGAFSGAVTVAADGTPSVSAEIDVARYTAATSSATLTCGRRISSTSRSTPPPPRSPRRR